MGILGGNFKRFFKEGMSLWGHEATFVRKQMVKIMLNMD